MSRGKRPLLILLAALATSTTLVAQDSVRSPFDEEFLRSFPEKSTTPEGPRLTFKLLNEIRLPGPLPGAGPRLVGDRVVIPVAGFVAVTTWDEQASPRLEPEAAASVAREPAEESWAESPDGKNRYQALPEGRIVGEKRCTRCKRGWRRSWRLRVAGSTVAPPLVTPDRVYFGAMDNRLYCVKRRNGHRIWVADAESRLSRPLVLWQVLGRAPGSGGSGFELILTVPDDRPEVQAWNAQNGERVATFSLSEEGGRLIGVPLATPDGKIIVARQNYAPADASLMVLQLAPPAALLAEPEPPEPPDRPVSSGCLTGGAGAALLARAREPS
jgi:hypothetical protein